MTREAPQLLGQLSELEKWRTNREWGYHDEPQLKSWKTNQRRRVWTENNLLEWKNGLNSLEDEW